MAKDKDNKTTNESEEMQKAAEFRRQLTGEKERLKKIVNFEGADPQKLNAFAEIVANATLGRRELIDRFFDPRRDVGDECGYPDSISVADYKSYFDRFGIAKKVVTFLPEECWQVQPQVFETEDDEETQFEKDWKELEQSLRAESFTGEIGKSWFQDDEGSPIWELLKRVDMLAGIGHFAIIYFALDDIGEGESAEKPVEFGRKNKILFACAFDESLVDIVGWETDQSSPRFGLPLYYNITLSDPSRQTSDYAGEPSKTMKVHHSRVLHFADNLVNSEIWGEPRMQPVFNTLYDLRKLYGGSAEMYWRGAFPGLSIETVPQLGADVLIDEEEMRDTMEQYMNGLQRYFWLTGMQAKSLAPQVVDPSPQIEVQITLICITVGAPKRIFMGSERGELASSQDSGHWTDRLRNRQITLLTPRLIVKFVDRVIAYGAVSEPKEGFSIKWPDIDTPSEAEKMEVSLKKIQIIVQYLTGGVEAVMTTLDLYIRLLDMDREEAEAVVDAVRDLAETEDEETESPLLKLVGGVTGMVELFKLHAEGGLTPDQLKQLIMLLYKVDDQHAEDIIADGREAFEEMKQKEEEDAKRQADALKQMGEQNGPPQEGDDQPPGLQQEEDDEDQTDTEE